MPDLICRNRACNPRNFDKYQNYFFLFFKGKRLNCWCWT